MALDSDYMGILLIAVLIRFPIIRETFEINIPSVSMLITILGFGIVVFLCMELIKTVLKKRTQTGMSIEKISDHKESAHL